MSEGLTLAIPVFILHVLAFASGYLIPRLGLKLSEVRFKGLGSRV